MEKKPVVLSGETVKLRDLEFAFDFVADAPPCEHTAYVSRSTSQTYLQSEWGDEEELPEDLEESGDLLEIPHFNDLLGRRLVSEFVAAELPERDAEVGSFFNGPGGYRLYKRLLAELGLLDRWHEFEDRRRRETVVDWCNKNGIELDSE